MVSSLVLPEKNGTQGKDDDISRFVTAPAKPGTEENASKKATAPHSLHIPEASASR